MCSICRSLFSLYGERGDAQVVHKPKASNRRNDEACVIKHSAHHGSAYPKSSVICSAMSEAAPAKAQRAPE